MGLVRPYELFLSHTGFILKSPLKPVLPYVSCRTWPSSTLTSFSDSCLEAMREVWSMLSRALLMLRAHTCSPSWRQRAVTFPPWRENLRRVLSSDSLGNKNTRWAPPETEEHRQVGHLEQSITFIGKTAVAFQNDQDGHQNGDRNVKWLIYSLIYTFRNTPHSIRPTVLPQSL